MLVINSSLLLIASLIVFAVGKFQIYLIIKNHCYFFFFLTYFIVHKNYHLDIKSFFFSISLPRLWLSHEMDVLLYSDHNFYPRMLGIYSIKTLDQRTIPRILFILFSLYFYLCLFSSQMLPRLFTSNINRAARSHRLVLQPATILIPIAQTR